MDEVVEQKTADLQRTRYADNSVFKFGRNSDFAFEFTRPAKGEHYVSYKPFTDAGSFQSRKYFTRSDYEVQNPINGGMQIRPTIPRMRKAKVLN
tara:strand:- start:949 stop:1230 length:282 start_codon:yes stop_codon:yes gene_type:complete